MNQTPNFKLLVTYHKPAVLLNAEDIVPIHIGRKLADNPQQNEHLSACDLQWLKENMIGDDTGDNISELNDTFNEMTAIYWAWKNYDELGNPDWIGFAHYRRHFMANPNDKKTIFKDFDFIDARYLERINYKHLPALLEGIDFLTVNEAILPTSVYEDYKTSPNHNIEDLDLCLSVIAQKSPEMLQTAKEYLNKNKMSYCNMFIMKKEIFFKYAEWIFAIMFEVSQQKNTNGRNAVEKRCFYSERLSGIFLASLKKKHHYLSVPLTFILNTDLPQEIHPKFKNNSSTVVFASNDIFTPYLATSLYSLIKHSDTTKNYDVFILDNNISNDNKQILKKQEQENISIRFISVIPYLNKVDVSLLQLHNDFKYYTPDTYYRFLIPTIFKNFKKVVYLDGDTVVLKDISQLYDIALGNNLIAATKDLYMPLWRKKDSAMENYLKNNLKLVNPNNYFQAGVLIFNIEKMIEANSQDAFFATMQRLGKPWLQDQDVLNAVTQEKILFIDGRWNFDRNIEDFARASPQVFSKVYQGDRLNQYERIKSDPFIIHFAGPSKPWKYPDISYAHYFWEFARQTVFYEKILFNNILQRSGNSLGNKHNPSKKLSLINKLILIIQNEGLLALFKKLIKKLMRR